MDFNSQDLLNFASRNYILGDISIKEQVEFLTEQIEEPFNSGNINYFKKLKTMIKGENLLDETCLTLFNCIENTYPDIEFDFSEYDQHLADIFEPVYKTFVKNINKLVIIFLKQYMFNNKKRKDLVADYMNLKLPNYPKEQFGKKEFYILVSKLSNIVRSIADDDVKLSKFIEYIERDDKCPLYIEQLKAIMEKGLIYDHGVVKNILDHFYNSDNYNGDLNQLEMILTQSLIIPYLKDNGMESIRLAPIGPEDDTEPDDDDEETEKEDMDE